ncbi:MAG: TonB-dependent receptor [Alphaproteobacteria bacterium]|nr:TonB-dependent receptor [Alphaproteobacteria bacterium]MBU1513085.1 TonB-dependent receptor [Alphaproteobacteria bacterium]MBU2095193.1 TonB-dependent receptor [Alphaproteobacteria bacterium]MBU2150648.1 TonB-dependent receptor [Alphaproteobacteria bacterium]MBU2306093.1 TonB-dependent receptor [Alphaproteobacteria bacterium]
MAMPANAADADKAGSQLEEVIVTAQKREENVQTAPLAITAITGANLAKDRVLSIEDLAHNMTGISFTANSPQSSEINIRGVVNTRLSSPTADQSVSTFVDDVYVSRAGNLNSAFYDVARVEVVRGPQGVLLGKNVAGGAVNIISNAPSFDASGRMTVSLGNYDLKQTNGYITGPITESLAGRLSFQTIDRGGYYRDILHNQDLENLNSKQARIQLAYAPPSSDLRASLNVDYSKDSNDGVHRVGLKSTTLPASFTPWSGTRALIAALRPGGLKRTESLPIWPLFKGDTSPTPQGARHETYNIIIKVDKDVAENIRLSSITGYRNNNSFTLYDQTGLGPANGFNVAAPLLFAEPVNFIEGVNQVSQEIRLASTNTDSRFDWIIGAYYQKSNVHQYNRYWGESTVLPTLSGESHWDDHGHNRDLAAFAQVGFKITDDLKLEVGARYTKDKKYGFQRGIIVATGDRLNPNDTAPLTPLTTNFATAYGDSWNRLTPQATLRWTPNDASMAYATVSRGFKGGGFQNSASNAFAAQTPYDPETVTNYELGYKTELFDRRVRWNTAVFYMEYKNLQVQQTLASCLCNVISNAPGATIKGVETDFQFAPTSWLRAWASGSYVHGTYDKFVFAGIDNSGNWMQRTPRWTTAVGAEATTSVGSWEDALSARLSYRYQGKMPWAPENTTWEGSYGTLDGRVTLTPPDSPWSISVYGKNLGKTVYRTNIIAFFQEEMSSFGAPRTYGIELSASF